MREGAQTACLMAGCSNSNFTGTLTALGTVTNTVPSHGLTPAPNRRTAVFNSGHPLSTNFYKFIDHGRTKRLGWPVRRATNERPSTTTQLRLTFDRRKDNVLKVATVTSADHLVNFSLVPLYVNGATLSCNSKSKDNESIRRKFRHPFPPFPRAVRV